MAPRNTRGLAPQGRRGGDSGVTLADVASHAGVSAMTVSRVVNEDPRVIDATRQKVAQAIATLGYVPNRAARNLAGRRQVRIALLHANPSAAYLSELLIGSLAQAVISDAMLVVEQFNPPETARDLVSRLSKSRVDGVLLPPPLCDDASVIAALADAGLEVARIATGSPTMGGTVISIDDQAAAYAMTTHLIAQGHRRIGLIAGDPNQTTSALRVCGYEDALAKAGITRDPALIVPGDFTYRSGLDAAEQLLALTIRPTAIFACNDDMAAAAVAVAHRCGLDVPNDISVAGFDDTAMARTIWPELTTIRQPVAAMSRVALRCLTEAVRNGAKRDLHHRLEFELIQRGSDGMALPGKDGSTPTISGFQ